MKNLKKLVVRSGAFASLLFPSACSDNTVEELGITSQGSAVLTDGSNCSLRAEASSGTMVLMVPLDRGTIRISFRTDNIAVDPNAETADFGFLISRNDGTVEQLAQESIFYSQDGDASLFFAEAPVWMVRDLAKLDNVSIVWDGVIASMAAPR
ncbi:MAG: hypothetical protein AAF697_03735 [Pseudomonadota bacterium]